MANVYISDTHLGHANIIKYCERPFKDVWEMDRVIVSRLCEAEAEGHAIFHLGDVAMNLTRAVRFVGWLSHPERHTLIVGNHDAYPKDNAYDRAFGRIVGTKKSWRENVLLVEDELDGAPVKVLLSHDPQRDLRGADINLYGHHHNNIQRKPEHFPYEEWSWLLESTRHINVSSELLDYRPRTLKELMEMRASGAWLT